MDNHNDRSFVIEMFLDVEPGPISEAFISFFLQ